MLPRKPARIASAKCFTGKMSATVVIHVGASSSSGMKMPDRNSSGRIVAFTIGGAASAFGITQVSASASAANDSDPTRNVDR